MQIIAVDSSTLQFTYNFTEKSLCIGDYIKIQGINAETFIAQVIQLASDQNSAPNNLGVAKILFSVFENNDWARWSGNIPTVGVAAVKVDVNEVLSNLNFSSQNKNISLGFLNQYNQPLSLNKKDFKVPTLIFSDDNKEILQINLKLAESLSKTGSIVVIFDLNGQYLNKIEAPVIVAGKDLHLPLNVKGIDSIYNKGLKQASAESRAVIEDIFLEVQNYIKTCKEGFLPFESFKSVVDAQYEQSKMVELVLLKNQLLKFQQESIFAQKADDFTILDDVVLNNNLVIVDLSNISEQWHKDFIEFVYDFQSTNSNDMFLFFEGKNNNLDKKLINKIYVDGYNSGIKSIISYNYNVPPAQVTMSFGQNFFLFAPVNATEKFATFASMFPMMQKSDFIAYGAITNHLPLLVGFDNSLVQTPVEQEFEPEMNEDIIEDEVISEEPFVVFEGTQEDEDQDDAIGIASFESENEEIVEYSEEDDFDLSEMDLEVVPAHNQPAQSPMHQDPVKDEISNEVESLYTSTPGNVKVQDSFVEQNIPSSGFVNDHSNNEIPIFTVDQEQEGPASKVAFEEGDMVSHQKYGTGTVKKIIGYGNKKLCSIQFDGIGRRLLDPELAVIEKL